MPGPASVADQWRAAHGDGRPFACSGPWGAVRGSVFASRRVGGLFPRPASAAGDGPVALVAPRWPGLEDEAAASGVDDALALGLLHAGIRVARVERIDLAPLDGVSAWIDAIVDCFHAVRGGSAGSGLAGSWLSGTACAVAASRIEGIGFLACAGAPSAEVMTRRTPEDEDDPKWSTSATLRLADGLAERAPLEAVTAGGRPALFVQGAADGALPAAHLDAWRAALAASGRPCDAVEVAFADAFFRTLDADGRIEPGDGGGLRLLAAAVTEWVARSVTRAGARRAR